MEQVYDVMYSRIKLTDLFSGITENILSFTSDFFGNLI